MIGALFALALQTTEPAAPPPAPAPHNAADVIADILAQTPPDGPPTPVDIPMPIRIAPTQPATAQATPTEAPAPKAAVTAVQPPIQQQVQAETPSADERTSRYEASLRSSFQAREARQGELDGRWTLSGADGQSLYSFQLADPGQGRGPVEGAWLAHGGVSDASGFIDAADRSERTLTLSFQDSAPRTVTLTRSDDGRWTGQMRTGDQSRPVVMARP